MKPTEKIRVLKLVGAAFLGAFLLSLLSIPQKLLLLPHNLVLVPKGFIVSIFFGALSGFIIGRLFLILQDKNALLRKQNIFTETVFNSTKTGLLILEKQTKNIVKINHEAILLLEIENNIPALSDYESLLKLHFSDYSSGRIIKYNRNESKAKLLWISIKEFSINNCDYIFFNFQDVSEQLNFYDQRSKTEQHEFISHISQKIGHEMNNLLSIISNYAQLNVGSESIEDIRNYSNIIAEQAQKGSTILQSIQNITESLEKEVQIVDVKTIICNFIDSVQVELVDNEIKLIRNWKDAGSIRVSIFNLNLILINILKNAIHALNGREKRILWVSTFANEDKVVIQIKDSGSGMSEEVISKIFSPVFSTKDENLNLQGLPSGFGLFLTKVLVNKYDGIIKVNSKVNEGTEVTITFPQVIVE